MRSSREQKGVDKPIPDSGFVEVIFVGDGLGHAGHDDVQELRGGFDVEVGRKSTKFDTVSEDILVRSRGLLSYRCSDRKSVV